MLTAITATRAWIALAATAVAIGCVIVAMVVEYVRRQKQRRNRSTTTVPVAAREAVGRSQGGPEGLGSLFFDPTRAAKPMVGVLTRRPRG